MRDRARAQLPGYVAGRFTSLVRTPRRSILKIVSLAMAMASSLVVGGDDAEDRADISLSDGGEELCPDVPYTSAPRTSHGPGASGDTPPPAARTAPSARPFAT